MSASPPGGPRQPGSGPAPAPPPASGGPKPARSAGRLAGVVVIVLVALTALIYGTVHPGGDGPVVGVGDGVGDQARSTSAHSRPDLTSADCASGPSRCGYPDATNTGVPAGVSLSAVNGGLTIRTDGAVVSGKDIHGCVSVLARNVTIRQSKIHCPNDIAVQSFGASNSSLLIQDSEIDCVDTAGTAVGDTSVTARRVNIHGCENGFDVDNNITVEDSYIHDLNQRPDNHSDGLQLNPGSGVTVRHNTIFVPGGTSAMISSAGGNSNVLVADNILAGGAYTLYCPRDSTSDFVVIDNRFSPIFSPHAGAFGAWTYCANATERHGNVWDNNLKPLTDND